MNLENIAELKDVSKVRHLNTETLFEGQNEILIVHHDAEYRLRITKNDRLILTK